MTAFNFSKFLNPELVNHFVWNLLSPIHFRASAPQPLLYTLSKQKTNQKTGLFWIPLKSSPVVK